MRKRWWNRARKALDKPHPFKQLKEWASEPSKRIRQVRRYRFLERFARKQQHNSRPGSRRRTAWRRRKKSYRRRADEIERRIKPDFKVYSRSFWGAGAPRSKSYMTSTSNGLFIHHTVAGAPTTVEGEKAEMRNLQRIAWSRGFNDISYSFVVFPSGRVYEGRGLNVAGAHTAGYNSSSYAASAAGNYDSSQPTDALVQAMRWVRRDYLSLKRLPLRPHSEVYATACPGRYLRVRLNEL